MSFVYPAFLWALAALAIPLIIHLFNFRRFRTVYFTNVRFLKNIQEETATRTRLKHLLILIARLFALAGLIFAFAQPFIPSKNKEVNTSRHAVGIYIDNSFSMEAINNDEQLLDIAKRKAEEIVNGYTVDDEFQLLTNDFEARHQRLLSKEEILQMITEIQLSPVVQKTNEVFKRQKDILNRSEDANKLVYLLSDFQKNAMDLQNDSAFQINLIKIESSKQRNIAIDSVWFITPVQMMNEQLQLCILVKNYSDDEVKNVPVTLKLNDQIKSLTDVTVDGHSEVIDTLSFIVQDAAWQNGEISITDYPVAFDDRFYFSFEPVSKIPVLCINGNSPNQFINSVFGDNPLFELVNYSANQIQFSELGKFSLLILNEVQQLSGGLSQALIEQISKGGNVVLIPAADMDKNTVNTFLGNFNAGNYGDVINLKRNVTAVNMKHPLFAEVFEKIPKNLAMPSATKSFVINSFSNSMEEQVLTFADGKPMIATYPARKGNILLFSSPLSRDYTDLPVQGGYFVLVMYKFAISSHKAGSLYSTIGDDKWIVLNDFTIAGDQTVKVKSKETEFIPEMRNAGTDVEVNLSNYTNLAGLYQVVGSSASQTIALNYNRIESDLTFYSEDDLNDLYDIDNLLIIHDPGRNLTGMITQMSNGTPLWKYCVIFALLFLAVEILLIRFLPS